MDGRTYRFPLYSTGLRPLRFPPGPLPKNDHQKIHASSSTAIHHKCQPNHDCAKWTKLVTTRDDKTINAKIAIAAQEMDKNAIGSDLEARFKSILFPFFRLIQKCIISHFFDRHRFQSVHRIDSFAAQITPLLPNQRKC